MRHLEFDMELEGQQVHVDLQQRLPFAASIDALPARWQYHVSPPQEALCSVFAERWFPHEPLEPDESVIARAMEAIPAEMDRVRQVEESVAAFGL